jgi:hypothetical protein
MSCDGGGGANTGGGNSGQPATDIILTAAPVSVASIYLSWNKNFTSSPDDHYTEIFRSGGGTLYSPGFSISDPGLNPETEYCYTAYYTECYFFIGYYCVTYSSNRACATTMKDTEAPSVPSTLAATALSKSEIKLTWNGSTDNAAVSGYKIFRGGAFFTISPAPDFTDNSLAPGSSSCYQVSAYDAAGNESALSSEACATTMLTDFLIDSAADGLCYNNSMTIDSTDKLHLAYINRTGSTSYELRYATNASGAWVTTAVDPSWGYPSIAADPSNKVHIATHAKYLSNATGTWTSELYDVNGRTPSIAVEPSGKAHISYSTEIPVNGYPERRINYALNSSGSWTAAPIMTTFLSPGTSLDIDSQANAHIAYVDGYPSSYLMNLSNATGTWSSSSLAYLLPGDNSCMLTPSTVIDPSDKVHIAVANIYATNASGSWRTEIYDPSGSCPAIALDPSAAPRIVYKAFDATTASHRLKHAVRGPSGWQSSAFSVVPQPSGFISLAVDSSGVTHVSYCNGGDIVYLKK